MRTFLSFVLALFTVFSIKAQAYQLTDADGNVVCTGSESVGRDDVSSFANALLWAIDKCPKHKDNITDCDMDALKFTTKLYFQLKDNPKCIYECNLTVQIASQRLFFLVNDINLTTSGLLGKKTPFEKLKPNKKSKDKEYYNEFTKMCADMLRDLLKFVNVNSVPVLDNWDKVKRGEVVKGMLPVECRLVLGKPINIHETSQKVQWMYSTSTYLFFEDGKLKTYLK